VKKWESFYPYVLPDVRGCPDPVIDQALVLAARDFCARTLVWQVDTDATTTIADVSDYDFDINQQQEVVKFSSATLNGRDLPVIAENDLPTDWRANMAQQRECTFTLDRITFTIVPTPSAEVELTTKLIVQPSLSATGIEDSIYDQYARQIAFGAKAILMMANDKPYSNLPLAAANQSMFDQAIARAAIVRSRGYGQRRRRVNALNY
jgi:hypothetical protein